MRCAQRYLTEFDRFSACLVRITNSRFLLVWFPRVKWILDKWMAEKLRQYTDNTMDCYIVLHQLELTKKSLSARKARKETWLFKKGWAQEVSTNLPTSCLWRDAMDHVQCLAEMRGKGGRKMCFQIRWNTLITGKTKGSILKSSPDKLFSDTLMFMIQMYFKKKNKKKTNSVLKWNVLSLHWIQIIPPPVHHVLYFRDFWAFYARTKNLIK